MEKYKSVFWYPDFSLPLKTREKVADLIGSEHVDRIEKICQKYLGEAANQKYKSKQGEINKKLREIHDSASKIAEALSDEAVRLQLSVLIQEHLPLNFFSRHGTGIHDLAEDMYTIELSTKSIPEARRGRPGGGGRDEAAWSFAYSLYRFCEKAGHTPTRINTEELGGQGIIHRLLDVLREPLGIGAGEMNGIFDNLIIAVHGDT